MRNLVELSAVTVKGPAIGPVGPTIRTTAAGVNVAAFIGRSKVTSILLTVLLRTRLSAVCVLPLTVVATTCGPGTMIGAVSVEYGGRKNVPVQAEALVGLGTA